MNRNKRKTAQALRKNSIQTEQQTAKKTAERNRQRWTRVFVSLLLVACVLFSSASHASHALESSVLPEETEATATIDPAKQTEQNTPEPSETATPTPEATEPTPASTEPTPASIEPTPAATEPTPEAGESTPEPEPEATQTPTQTELLAQNDGATLRLLTVQTEDEKTYSLALSRITADSDADAFSRYRAILANILSAEQAERCVVYELRYTANGESITPPQADAQIELTDPLALATLETDSLRAFWLTGNESLDSAEMHSAAMDLEEDKLSFSCGACPDAIVLYGEAAAAATETPAPDAATPTPEPSASPLYEYDNNGLYVSGSPADSDVLPEGATLLAERITRESDSARYEKYAEMLGELYGTEFPISFNAYDISFHVEGQEVEPTGDVVNVTIRDSAFVENVEAPLVYHVVNEQSAEPVLQEIPAQAQTSEGQEQVVFSADSFSTYIVLANGITLTLADNSGLTYKIIATAADQFTNTSYYNSNRVLGIAGNFHIVAFDTATLSAHTNGNVLANQVVANSNFGTNGLTDELSYIQNYTQVNGVSASNNSHVLVLGNTHDTTNVITAVDNGNSFAISGTKLDRPRNLWQDQATATLPFIDLVALKASNKSLASTLAAMSPAYTENHLSTSGGSADLSYLTLTNPDKIGIFNLTAAQLSTYSYIGVKGLLTGRDGGMIINVDCSGVSGTITLPEIRVFMNGTLLNLTEVTSFVNGRVLVNLLNCTATVNTRLLYASLLAPDATVNLQQNMNGTVIANRVTVSAESHRDDFVGRLNNGETITGTKVWSDYGTGSPASTSVTLQLYRSTDSGATRTAYGTPVTLNATTGWSYSWTELPTGSLYTIVETSIMKDSTNMTANYATTYSTQTGVASGTITVTNQYLYALPDTGGGGTGAFTLCGAGLLLIAVLLFQIRRRTMRA